MYMHCADCHLEFLLLGQEEGRLPPNGNLPVKLIQHVASKKKKVCERVNLIETFDNR